MVRRFEGRTYDAHYLAFFECFNSGRFYEAHEVLEQIWLPQRRQPNGSFYKALIQIAGAFVHLQKGRSQPAGALLRLAKANLEVYPPVHDGLNLANVRSLIGDWLLLLEKAGSGTNPSGGRIPNPKLGLT